MTTTGDRIKTLRQHLGLTQKDFGERIGVKGNTIATYEIGRNEPIDAVMSLIVREFDVNEVWLRTGAGEMFQPLTQYERISSFVGNALQDAPESFRLRLVDALAVLTPEDWEILTIAAQRMANAWGQSKKDQADAQSLQGESPED